MVVSAFASYWFFKAAAGSDPRGSGQPWALCYSAAARIEPPPLRLGLDDGDRR